MTRRHGAVDSAAGLTPFGHLGWSYRDRGEFFSRAAEYIADGLARDQWVEYVGAGDHTTLRAELAELPGLADVSGVKVSAVPQFYGVPPGGDVVDPEIAVATQVAAVHEALRQGYSGFRAVVDATSMSERPHQRDALSRFEFLVDRQMAVFPMSALCAFDVGRLGSDAAALACLHPLVGEDSAPFQLYAEPGVQFTLAGEVDSACADTFTTALGRIWPLISGREVTVDARGLAYIGHRQLLELDRRARSDRSRVVLRTGQPILIRLAGLLNLTNVRVVAADRHDGGDSPVGTVAGR